jgi:hypothetical protein
MVVQVDERGELMNTPEQPNTSIWTWVRDETNRKVLAWIGSGLVAAATGAWVIYEKWDEKRSEVAEASTASEAPTQRVSIGGNGIVAGRDVNQGSFSASTGADGPGADAPAVSSDISIGGDGVVGGRDVNTDSIRIGD